MTGNIFSVDIFKQEYEMLTVPNYKLIILASTICSNLDGEMSDI